MNTPATLPNSTAPDVQIQVVPASMSVNYDELKAAIEKHLEKYQDIVVTADTVKDGKALLKEISAARKDLDVRRKAEVAKLSEPVKEFDAKLKELVSLHDSVMTELKDQISKFEEEKKKGIGTQLTETLNKLWGDYGVREEFRKADISGLILLSNQTAKGKLTAKALNELTYRAQQDQALQSRTDLRLSQLTSQSYEAGLAAPLNEGHVQQFLLNSDEEYQTKLDALLASEIERENQAIALRAKQQVRNEVRAGVQQEAENSARAALQPHIQAVPDESHENTPMVSEPITPTPGAVTVTCTFDIPVAAHVPEEAVQAAVLKKLEEAGFTTLTSISATRNQQEAA